MNLTQAKRKANLAAWKATPPAVIKSPLKHLHTAYPDIRKNGHVMRSPQYLVAVDAANKGNGALVKRMALAII